MRCCLINPQAASPADLELSTHNVFYPIRQNSTSGFHLLHYFNGAYENLAASQWSGHGGRAAVHDVPYWIPEMGGGLLGSSWQHEAGTR